jgi:hypothetical protein
MVMRKELPMTTAEFEIQMSSFLGKQYRLYVDYSECVLGNNGD